MYRWYVLLCRSRYLCERERERGFLYNNSCRSHWRKLRAGWRSKSIDDARRFLRRPRSLQKHTSAACRGGNARPGRLRGGGGKAHFRDETPSRPSCIIINVGQVRDTFRSRDKEITNGPARYRFNENSSNKPRSAVVTGFHYVYNCILIREKKIREIFVVKYPRNNTRLAMVTRSKLALLDALAEEEKRFETKNAQESIRWK